MKKHDLAIIHIKSLSYPQSVIKIVFQDFNIKLHYTSNKKNSHKLIMVFWRISYGFKNV